MVEGKWYASWVAFVTDSTGLVGQPASIIDNRSLLQPNSTRPRTNLIQSRDYYSVVPELWLYIAKIYKPTAKISCRYKSIYSTQLACVFEFT